MSEMYFSLFKEISPLFTKITVNLLFLFYLNHLCRSGLKSTGALRSIFFILLIRDLLFAALNIILVSLALEVTYEHILILVISDICVIAAYLFWLKNFSAGGPGLLFYIINIPLILLYLVLTVFRVRTSIDKYMHWIFWLWLIGNQLYLAIRLYQVSPYNTKDGDVVIISRRLFIFIFLTGGFFTYIFVVYKNFYLFLIQTFIIPFTYFMHIYILSKYSIVSKARQDRESRFIQNDLNSLFKFLKVMVHGIADKLSIGEILNYIIESTKDTTGADAGAILMIEDSDVPILKVKAVAGFFPPFKKVSNQVLKVRIKALETYFISDPINMGETVLGESARNGEAIFIRNSVEDPRMVINSRNDTQFVSSVMVIPLLVSKQVAGVLAVIKRKEGEFFKDSDFDHFTTFAEFASLAVEFLLAYLELLDKRERDREMKVASEIQQKLLPRRLPLLKNGHIGAYSVPAKEVSGDYYDVLRLRGGKVMLAICDVAGKGYPAALIMVMIRSILHLIASPDRDMAATLTWINRGIFGQIEICYFATMSLMLYDQDSGVLTYSNAAHHPLLIYRKQSKSIESIDTSGLPIGVKKDSVYTEVTIKLNSGDVVVLFTDGITEAMSPSGELYETYRLKKLINDTAHLSSGEIIDEINKDIENFVNGGSQHDDQTLLLMKID